MNVLVKTALAAATLLAVGCASGAAASAASAASASAASASGASASAATPRGSVPACIAFGVRAINEHQTVTEMPAACRGLSRSEINFALGRAIYLVAGSGQRKVAWRHRAAIEGARLAKLITALAQSSSAAGPGPSVAGGSGGRTGPVDRRPLGLAALIAWLLTVGTGGYMLGRFVVSGGLRRQWKSGDRTSPAVVLSHFFLASTGLLLWAVYLATSVLAVAWVAVAVLLPVIGFGMGTLILWSIGSSRRPSGTSSAPSGTTGASSETSPPAGAPSPVSAEPSSAAAEPAAVAAEPSAVAAEPSPAGAPGQVQVAEPRDQAAAGRPAPAPRPSRWLTVVLPIVHGLFAMTTILLALLTALGAT